MTIPEPEAACTLVYYRAKPGAPPDGEGGTIGAGTGTALADPNALGLIPKAPALVGFLAI